MASTNDDIRLRVKQIRERLALTQEAFADTIGVSFATVNRWENGWTMPSRLALKQIESLCRRRKIASPFANQNGN